MGAVVLRLIVGARLSAFEEPTLGAQDDRREAGSGKTNGEGIKRERERVPQMDETKGNKVNETQRTNT